MTTTIGGMAVQLNANTTGFTAAMAAAQKSAQKLAADLQRQVDTFGRTRNEARAHQLAQKGASQSTIDHVQALEQQRQALVAQQARMERGKSIFEQTRTPLERYGAQVKELDTLLKSNAINQDTYNRAVKQFQPASAMGGISGMLSSAGEKFTSFVSSILGGGAAVAGVIGGLVGGFVASFSGLLGGVFSVIGSAFERAAAAESRFTEFKTMLGSATGAKNLMKEIQALAVETPLETPELAKGGKKLLGARFQADEIVPTLRMLGDVASGVGEPFNEIVDLYTKISMAGRLTGHELLQFSKHSIPLQSTLADMLGKTDGEIKKMVEDGQIGFPQVEAAMQRMTSEGGLFHNMMKAQSTTMTGLMSTLRDVVGIAMTEIAQWFSTTFSFRPALLAASSAINALRNILGGFLTIVGALLSPITLILDTVFATVEVFATRLAKYFDQIGQGLSSIFGTSKAAAETNSTAESIRNAWNSVFDFLEMIGEVIGELTAKISNMLGQMFGGGFSFWDGKFTDEAKAQMDEFNRTIDLGIGGGGTMAGKGRNRLAKQLDEEFAAMESVAAKAVENFGKEKWEIELDTMFDSAVAAGRANDTASLRKLDAQVQSVRNRHQEEDALKELKMLNEDLRKAQLDAKEKLATFGMSDVEKEAHGFRDRGAGEEDIARIQRMRNQLQLMMDLSDIKGTGLSILDEFAAKVEALNDANWAGALDDPNHIKAIKALSKSRDEHLNLKAGSLRKELASPLEKYNAELLDLQKLLDAKKISPELFGQAAGKLLTDLESATGKEETRGPEAFLQGSKEAFSAIFAHERGASDNPQVRIEKALDRANEHQRWIEQHARDLKDAFAKIIVARVG